MDFELWWLLPIPALFFAMGWIAARIDIKHLLRESRALPLSYFRGLNFLLNEQPDKAIESFIEVVKVDPQTIDLHFALGNLFRRQGEIDRAIRMHQNLLDRPDLPADKRQTAVFELAQDFHRAGLLDRAEELFSRLDGGPFEVQALGFLLQIYEQETSSLADLQPGDEGVFVRVSDSDPAMLRYLADRGIAPGAAFEVIERQPFDGPLFVRFGDDVHVLGGDLARAMRVEED